MAGLFSGLGNYLFGTTPVSSQPYTQESNQLNAGSGQYANQEQNAYGQQQQLTGNLWNTINGNGPSIADIQLQQALDQNLRNGLAMGAGGSGENGVLARYLAATQTGNSAAGAAQSGALLRAKEIADARAQLGQTTGQMANEGGNLYGTNLSTGLGYANLANNVNQGNRAADQQSQNMALGALSGLGGGIGSFLGKSPSGGGGGSAAGGGGGSDALLGSSDPAVSNAAWDAFAA